MIMRKTMILATCALFFMLKAPESNAQSYFSFQSIQQHTFFFSLTWNKKFELGVGYGYRTDDIKFFDVTVEYRAPIDEFFSCRNFEVITGFHGRYLTSRNVISGGTHVRFGKTTTESIEYCYLGMALTFMPGYQYKTSLSDKPNGVIAALFTYNPLFVAWIHNQDGSKTAKSFGAHTLEVGGHFDILIQRTAGIATNPRVVKTWASDELKNETTEDWQFKGDFYFGPSFWVDRN